MKINWCGGRKKGNFNNKHEHEITRQNVDLGNNFVEIKCNNNKEDNKITMKTSGVCLESN